MPTFRVHQAVKRLSRYREADADAGADRYVEYVLLAFPGAEERLADAGGVDVAVYYDRDADGILQSLPKAAMRPFLPRAFEDSPVIVSAAAEVHRAESADSQGGYVVFGKEIRHGGNVRVGGGGREPHPFGHGSVFPSHGTDYLRAADFYGSEDAIVVHGPESGIWY